MTGTSEAVENYAKAIYSLQHRAGGDPVATAFTSFALVFRLVEFRRKAPFLHGSLESRYTPRA